MPSVRKRGKKNVAPVTSKWTDSDSDANHFEGGTSKSKKKDKKSKPEKDADQEVAENEKRDEEAANKVKNLFSKNDVLGHTHLKEVGDDLQKHGSKEKTGFMEKEAEFVKNLKSVQTYHLDTCTLLLKIGIFVMFLQFVYSCFCIAYFGCGVGDCENGLVCYVYYIKFC